MSMILQVSTFTKSSITEDADFRKDLPYRGALLDPHASNTLFKSTSGEFDSTLPFKISPSPRGHPTKLNPPQESGRSFETDLVVVRTAFGGPITHWGAGPTTACGKRPGDKPMRAYKR